MANNSTAKRSKLGRHARGLWYKKYQGRFYYFYKIDEDPKGQFSIEKWEHDKSYIDQGQEPPEYDPLGCTESCTTTVRDLCNHWLGHKETLLVAGELAQRTYDEYTETCKFLVSVVGRTLPAHVCGPQRFDEVRLALAKKYNANGQAKRITQIRSVFDVAYEDRLLSNPPNFGRSFRKPKASSFRKLRNAQGDRTFTPKEIDLLTSHCDLNLKAMILLGLNCGMGNEDCAALPRSAIKDGWLTWARVKTAVPRRVPLWPETLEAIQACIAHADSKGESDLCFISDRGKNYISSKLNGHRVYGVFRAAAARVKKSKKITIEKTFYDLRRTFETIAGDKADQVAVDAIMGHTPSESNMAARYRQRISDERLQAVCEHVRQWWKGGAK